MDANILRRNLTKSRDKTSFTSAAMASKHLAPHWMERLIEDNENEEPAGWRIKLLDRQSRSAVWSVCSLLGVTASSGAAAQACRLLERYLASRLQDKFATLDSHRLEQNYQYIWEDYKRYLGQRIPLLMASCVQLAAKMSCAGVPLTATKVKTALATKGLEYTIDEVIQAEFKVFRSLGFRLPLYTSLETALLLAQEAGCGARGLLPLAGVVEAAELHRCDITRRTLWLADVADTGDPMSGGTVRTLQLCAGAVSASRELARGPSTSSALIYNLAKLTRSPHLLISCLSKLIVQAVLSPESLTDGEDDDHEGYSRKRRHISS